MISGVARRFGPMGSALSGRAIRGWAVWSVPCRVMLPVLTVEITPLVLVLTQITTTPLDSRVLLLTVVLCGVGTVHTEIAVRVESVRRRVTTDTAHVDLCSVWTFAAAIVLPPALAALVAVIVSAHQWWRSYRPCRS